MATGEPYALRLDSGEALARFGPLTFTDGGRGTIAVDADVLGDAVIARKDVPASYHLAVVVDDAEQRVTLVTRGEDLFEATHLQRLLQASLGLPEPRYHHHRLFATMPVTGFPSAKGPRLWRHCAPPERTPVAIRQQLDSLSAPWRFRRLLCPARRRWETPAT